MFDFVKDEHFREMGDFRIIGTTHGSLQLHIPSKAKRALKLEPTVSGGQMMRCYMNTATKQILYELIKDDKEEKKEEKKDE